MFTIELNHNNNVYVAYIFTGLFENCVTIRFNERYEESFAIINGKIRTSAWIDLPAEIIETINKYISLKEFL